MTSVTYKCLISEWGRRGSGLMYIPVMWMSGMKIPDLRVHAATWYWSFSKCVFVTANVSCLMTRRTPPRPLDVVVGSHCLSFLKGD